MINLTTKIILKYFQLNNFQKEDTPILRHNLKMHIIDGLIFMCAMSFVSIQTIIPVFVQQMGGNSIAVGSVQVLWAIGLSLPQLLFVNLYQHQPKIKPSLLKYGFIHRTAFLLMGLFSFFFINYLSANISVIIFLTIFFAGAVTGSMAIPPWYHLFSKTTPVKLRGRLLAIRQLIGSVLGIGAGFITSLILSSIVFPKNFSLLFFISFFLMIISFYFLYELKETNEDEINSLSKSKSNFHQAKIILQTNPNFKFYLVADAIQLVAMTSLSFFAVYALKKFSLPSYYAGSFTIIVMISMSASNIFFGFLGDKFGHKINLLLISFSLISANLIAVFSSSIFIYAIVFFLIASVITLQGISRLSFVVELCSSINRPLFIAVQNTITAPFILFGIFAGWMISVFNYELVFIIYAVISTLSFFWLLLKVKEPRNHKDESD